MQIFFEKVEFKFSFVYKYSEKSENSRNVELFAKKTWIPKIGNPKMLWIPKIGNPYIPIV